VLSAAIREERILRGFDPDEIVLDMQNRIDKLKYKPSKIEHIRGYGKVISNNHPENKNRNKNFEPEL